MISRIEHHGLRREEASKKMVYWELNNIKEKDARETTPFHIKSTTALQYFSIGNVEKRQQHTYV